jgi:hypothetical protein
MSGLCKRQECHPARAVIGNDIGEVMGLGS